MYLDIFLLVALLVVMALLFTLLQRLGRMRGELHGLREQLQDTVRDEAHGLFVQLEAYLSLRDRLNLRQGLPYTPYWSASPDFLKLIVEHSLEAKPQTVVECSSGLTTLMLARCCDFNRKGHVYSLENGAQYADKTRRHVERYELTQASVIHAPLEKVRIRGCEYDWYSLASLAVDSIDMLVIDGPPGFIQKHSRYPALPLLYDKLADGCMVFMDDAAREDEKAIVDMWLQEFSGIEHEFIKTERGCSVLTINKKPAGR